MLLKDISTLLKKRRDMVSKPLGPIPVVLKPPVWSVEPIVTLAGQWYKAPGKKKHWNRAFWFIPALFGVIATV